MSIEMATPADGSERHYAPKAIQKTGGNVNLDNDQDLMKATVRTNGKWQFFWGDKLLCEADDPGETTHGVVSAWCNAIRARTSRENSFQKGERKNDGVVVSADGSPLRDTDRDVGSVEDAEVQQQSSVSPDDDPDAFVQGKIDAAKRRGKAIQIKTAELQEQLDELVKEFEEANKDLQKWERMQGVINE